MARRHTDTLPLPPHADVMRAPLAALCHKRLRRLLSMLRYFMPTLTPFTRARRYYTFTPYREALRRYVIVIAALHIMPYTMPAIIIRRRCRL